MRRLLITLAALLAACSSVTDVEDERIERLEAAREAWDRNGAADYAYTFRASCECVPAFAGPARIVVADDAIVSATVEETGEPADPEWFHTVTDLFDLIEAAIALRPDDFDVEYDDTYGYPAMISIDYDRRVADDEFVFYVSELELD